MIRTVLLPTDLSDDSARVVRFASGLGSLGVRRVVVAHVLDATGMEGPVIAARIDQLRDELRVFAAPLSDAGLDVELRVATGEPGRELAALAAEAAVDAMVIGTAGRSNTDRFFVASVSDDLLRDARVPCLTVRYEILRNAGDPAAVARMFARVLLVPTDFSLTSWRALATMIDIPASSIGNIRVFHVLPSTDGPDAAKLDVGAEFQLRNVCAMAAERGLTASAVIGHGKPEQAIITEIDESGVTGVVMGFRGRSVLGEALMGSVSMTLMRQASCPVMIVP